MMISLPRQIEQLKAVKSMLVDESVFDIVMTALKSRKSRETIYDRLMEYAGTNKAAGAGQLRQIARNILNAENIGS